MGRKSREKRERQLHRTAIVREAEPKLGSPVPILALLAILTFAVFGQVRTHSFVNYDDSLYLYENPNIIHGLLSSSIEWALTSTTYGWYPLTWLSHMLDVQLWGLHAGAHLLTNVTLHAISVCILFLALRRMTAQSWPSAVVAALFAIHPMHVESVAWASERKDTLSTLFALMTLLVYAISPQRRLLLFVTMALSLVAKQMYITLPFVLLLLDFWPLQRMRTLRDLWLRVMEKLPLFGLTVFGAVMAVVGQKNLSAMQSMEAVPLEARLANALVGYVRYLGMLFVPTNLAVFYPRESISTATAVGCAVLLLAITAAAVRLRKSAPYFLVGWLWFLGTLVPVIGIVQIGIQSIADRYTYFSYIGLFIAIVWGAARAGEGAGAPLRRRILGIGAVVIVLILAAIAYRQVGYWKDSETLFARTIAVTPPNPLAEYSLGQALEMTVPDRAAAHLRRAISLVEFARGAPEWHAQAYVGLGTALLMQARPMPPGPSRDALIQDAIAQNHRALAIDPNAPHAKNNIALAQQWLSQR
jgi:tetratricopeptide (TPR) repeat protein